MLKRTVVVKSAWGDIVKLREGGYLVEFKRQDGSYADDSVRTPNLARARAELDFYGNSSVTPVQIDSRLVSARHRRVVG